MTNERTNNTSDSETNEGGFTVEELINKLEREITELKDSRLRAVADLRTRRDVAWKMKRARARKA